MPPRSGLSQIAVAVRKKSRPKEMDENSLHFIRGVPLIYLFSTKSGIDCSTVLESRETKIHTEAIPKVLIGCTLNIFLEHYHSLIAAKLTIFRKSAVL
jgi:hypothetical protein